MAWLQRALDAMSGRKRAYQLTFGSGPGHIVLTDLIAFCRANETCVVPGDPVLTGILEGRREVWLRIQNHMRLEPEQLMAIYAGKQYLVNQEDNNG